MPERVTIISTLDLAYRKMDLLRKFILFNRNIAAIGCQAVVAFAVKTALDGLVFKLLRRACTQSVHLLFVPCAGSEINNSYLRNAAARHVRTKYVILADIDLFFDRALLLLMLREAERDGFSMLPVLYLSREGTKDFLRHRNRARILDKWMAFEFGVFLHLAIATSLMCVSLATFEKIKGFDERYRGHGYEDFDFMLRVIRLYHEGFSASPRCAVDETYVSPLLARGFRAEIGVFTLAHVLRREIALHLFHVKNAVSHASSRERNKKLWSEKFVLGKTSLPEGQGMPRLVPLFYDKCRELGVTPQSFAVLFNPIPRWKIAGRGRAHHV